MPKGAKLKELWADQEWRSQRIKELRESQEWIDRRAKGLETARPRALMARKRRANMTNHDLRRALDVADRNNALLLYEMKLIKAENAKLQREAQAAIEAKDDAFDTFGLTESDFALRLLGFTATEARIVNVLLSREVVTKEQALFAAHAASPEDRLEVSTKLVDVFVCKIRPKLRKRGVEIETVWGTGWRLARMAKERLRAIMAQVQAENA